MGYAGCGERRYFSLTIAAMWSHRVNLNQTNFNSISGCIPRLMSHLPDAEVLFSEASGKKDGQTNLPQSPFKPLT